MAQTNAEIIERLMEGIDNQHPDVILDYLTLALRAGYTPDQISIQCWSGKATKPATPIVIREATSEEANMARQASSKGNEYIFSDLHNVSKDYCVENIGFVAPSQWFRITLRG